jgi:hypothetical protein
MCVHFILTQMHWQDITSIQHTSKVMDHLSTKKNAVCTCTYNLNKLHYCFCLISFTQPYMYDFFSSWKNISNLFNGILNLFSCWGSTTHLYYIRTRNGEYWGCMSKHTVSTGPSSGEYMNTGTGSIVSTGNYSRIDTIWLL